VGSSRVGRAGTSLELLDVVSIGFGANLRRGVLDSEACCASLELLVVVSIGSGANLRRGLMDSSGCDVSFELRVVVSIGCGANLRRGATGSSTCGTSFELLLEVSMGIGANRLCGLESCSDGVAVSFELRVDVSIGSTANLRGFLSDGLSSCSCGGLFSVDVDIVWLWWEKTEAKKALLSLYRCMQFKLGMVRSKQTSS
jgi:hypothetical protein